MTKVLIAVPTFENINPETFKSIYNLDIPPCIYLVGFDYVKGYDCARARNIIASKAIGDCWDYVLMVDSDIVLPPDCLEKMLEEPTGILFGVYPRKDRSNQSEIFSAEWDSYAPAARLSVSELVNHPSDRIEIRGGGFGCIMIRTDILKQMSYPYFKYVEYDDGKLLSEDLYFCEKVRDELNVKMYVDTRVVCGHITKEIL